MPSCCTTRPAEPVGAMAVDEAPRYLQLLNKMTRV
jgi:hypothetical protein